MFGLTLRKIIEDERFLSEYNDFIININEEIKMNNDKYYIYDIYPVHLNTEITTELLDEAQQTYKDYINKKKVIPFAKKPDFTNIVKIKREFNILKEIITESEKTNCCFSFTQEEQEEEQEEEITGAGSNYMFYSQMDEPNKKMMDICVKKGMDGMIQTIVDEMKNENMSYQEMRARYG